MSETISQNWRDFTPESPMDLTFTRFYEGTKVHATLSTYVPGDTKEVIGVIKPLTARSSFVGDEVVLNHRVKRVVFLEHP